MSKQGVHTNILLQPHHDLSLSFALSMSLNFPWIGVLHCKGTVTRTSQGEWGDRDGGGLNLRRGLPGGLLLCDQGLASTYLMFNLALLTPG